MVVYNSGVVMEKKRCRLRALQLSEMKSTVCSLANLALTNRWETQEAGKVTIIYGMNVRQFIHTTAHMTVHDHRTRMMVGHDVQFLQGPMLSGTLKVQCMKHVADKVYLNLCFSC